MGNSMQLFVLSASTPTSAPLYGKAVVNARAGVDAQFRRGIDLHADFDFAAKFDANYSKGFVAALGGGANIKAKLAFQACSPLDLFDEAGLVTRLEISAEAIAHISANLGLELDVFSQLIRNQIGDGPFSELSQLFIEESLIQVGFWAQAGFAATLRGQASFTGSLLPNAINGPGFSFDLNYGAGFGFGTGMNFRANIGFEEPRRLISRLADKLVNITETEFTHIIAKLSGDRADAAARGIELLKPLIRLSVHTAFQVGIDLASEPADRTATAIGSVVKKLTREVQNTLLNAVIELALDRVRQFFQSHDLEFAVLELDEQSRTNVITKLMTIKEHVSRMSEVSVGSIEWLDFIHGFATSIEDLLKLVVLEPELQQYLHVSFGILASATTLVSRIVTETLDASLTGEPLVTGALVNTPTSEIMSRALGANAGTVFVLTDLANFLIDQNVVDKAVYRAPALGTVLDWLHVLLTIDPQGDMLREALLILDHLDQTSAQQILERLSPAVTRALNEHILPDLIKPLKQEGSENVGRFFDEIIIPTLATIPEVVIPRLPNLGSREDSKRLREAVSAILLQALRRFVVVTIDVLSKYALENGEKTFRQLSAEIRQVGERQPIVAAVTAMAIPPIWLPFPIPLPIRITHTDIASILNLAADVSQQFNGLPNSNHSPRQDLITLIDALLVLGLNDPSTRNTSLGLLTTTNDPVPGLNQMLERVANGSVSIALFVVPRLLALVPEHFFNEAIMIAKAIYEGVKAVIEAAEEGVKLLSRGINELKRQIEILARNIAQFSAKIAGEIKILSERLRTLQGLFIERIRVFGWSIIEPLISWAPPFVIAAAKEVYNDLFEAVKILLDLPLAILSNVAGWVQEALTTHLQGASVSSEHLQDAIHRRILSADCHSVGIHLDINVGIRLNLGTIVLPRGNILGELAGLIFEGGMINTTVDNCAQAATQFRNAEAQRATLQARLNRNFNERQAKSKVFDLTTGQPLNIRVSSPIESEAYLMSVPVSITIDGANLTFVRSVLDVPRRVSIRLNGREYPYTPSQWVFSNNSINLTAVIRLTQREQLPQLLNSPNLLKAPVETPPIIDLSGKAIVSRNGGRPYVSSHAHTINRWRTEGLDDLTLLSGLRVVGKINRGDVFAIPFTSASGTAQQLLSASGNALYREQYGTVAPHPNGMPVAARLAEELKSGTPSRPVWEQHGTVASHPNGMPVAARLAEELKSGTPSRPIFMPGGRRGPVRGNPGLNVLQVAVSDGKNAANQHSIAVSFYLTTEGEKKADLISVEDIVYNPRGRDLQAGERVIIKSNSASPIDLTGWRFHDLARHTFKFPNGFILQPSATVTIYTKSGVNSSIDLYWGKEKPVWNNRGDALIMYDAHGNIVTHYVY